MADALREASPAAPGRLRSLILEKERELHDINEFRIKTLEALLRDKEAAAAALKGRLGKLQEDFTYNLKLLEGRDEELAMYDANFAALKAALRDREAELSELQAAHAQLAAENKQGLARAREQEAFYQQKLKDARAQMDGARWEFDGHVRSQQETADAARRQLERQLREKEDEADAQRREMSEAFDELLRTRAAEHKVALDELQAANRELELKSKSAAREVDVLNSRLDEMKRKLERATDAVAERDKEVKALEWQLADTRSAKDARINDLESEIDKLKETKQALLDEYEAKMAELLQSLHAVEQAFVQQKAQLDDELKQTVKRKEQEAQVSSAKLEAKISSLTAKLRDAEDRGDRLEAELKQTAWEKDDLSMEKDREVEKLKGELQDLDDQRQAAIAELKQQLWSQDRDAVTLREKLKDVTSQLQIQKEKEKVQRQELLDAVDKQEDLRREVLAANLRWENKLQQEKQELENRYDLRARGLQQAKDRAIVEKQAVEERLAHAENELQQARSELRAAKADARINAAFGAVDGNLKQLTPVGSSKPSRSHDRDGVSSPLWSDDQGNISPGISMSPMLMTDSPTIAPQSNRNVNNGSANESGGAFSLTSERPGDLQAENAKLRDMIRQMKDAIIRQAEDAGSSSRGNENSTNSLIAFQLDQSEKRCAELEQQLQVIQQQQLSGKDSIERELGETQRAIQEKDATIAEMEATIASLTKELEVDAAIKSAHAALEAQNTDLKRKLAAANNDIDRLVRERAQLMDLSNQLRADLRKLVKSDGTSGSRALKPEFAGKKDYENLIAELTRSLDEARINNKTLKKELRRMVKLQVQQERHRDDADQTHTRRRHPESVASSSSSLEDGANPRRHTSTLSMMKNLDDDMLVADKRRSTATTTTSSISRKSSAATTGAELDAELLNLARHKRSSASESTVLRAPSRSGSNRRSVPPSIPEDGINNSEHESKQADLSRRVDRPPPPPPSALSSLFGRNHAEDRGSGGLFSNDTPSVAGTSASGNGVSDARMRLQQAKEMLILSGKKAPTRTSSLATRSSDRETTSQRDVINKMKELQSKRAEMASERKRVRNYSLAPGQ